MPRRPRITLPGMAHHIIQWGNNRHACFYGDEDYLSYLEWLEKYAEETGCLLHAYVLMTNHVHLLVTPSRSDSLGQLMKRLGQRYVQYINWTYRRSGTLWEGRFRSCIAGEDHYILACHRYIELNPVRATMVSHPAEYRWSSYLANRQGEVNALLTPHETYLRLGPGEKERRRAYRELFRYQLDTGVIDEIRNSTNGNYALGSVRFRAQVEEVAGRRVCPGKPGRPAKDD